MGPLRLFTKAQPPSRPHTRTFRLLAPRRAQSPLTRIPQPHHPSPNPPQRLRLHHQIRTRRTYSTGSGKSSAANDPDADTAAKHKAKATARVERILARLPRPLQRYTSRLRGAPLTHVVAFLVLHEITAVVPLLGLFGLFHYTEYVPVAYMMEHYGGYVRDGTGRFERYFRRKGWFGFGEGDGVEEERGRRGEEKTALELWEGDDGRYRVVVEVALAYAVTKVLLPVRIVASVWATPWFAGVLMRVRSFGRRGR
ncbi:hypothetical protein VTK56DRAFT_9448 [Thermocarpiscus australiensis]